MRKKGSLSASPLMPGFVMAVLALVVATGLMSGGRLDRSRPISPSGARGEFRSPAQAAASGLPLGTPAVHSAEKNPHRLIARPASLTRAQMTETFRNRPLTFEPNQGQTGGDVRFLARGDGYVLFLASDEAVLAFRGAKQDRKSQPSGAESNSSSVLRLKLSGASPSARAEGLEEFASKSHYFIGNDPRRWRANVPNYRQVRYRQVYPGVDLVYYGNQRQLEYDFIVEPGADPKVIVLVIEGLENSRYALPLRIDQNGDLVWRGEDGEIRFHKPVVYQTVATGGLLSSSRPAGKHFLEGRYVLRGGRRVAFEITEYDPTRSLVIDPVLTYSTYLGGSKDDIANVIAIDSAGNAYIAGATLSTNFPTASPLQSTCGGCDVSQADAFVAKINSAGSALVYSTYLGGSLRDEAFGIAVDSNGNAYVTGKTFSNNFPTASPLQAATGGAADAFLAKINAAGSALVYSTYLGGSADDSGASVAVDSSGNAYVTGSTHSATFPVINWFQGTCGSCDVGLPDAFVAKVNAAGSALAYSTYLGGSSRDEGTAIALDSTGRAYVTGRTFSNNFPTASAFQASFGGIEDAFITKVNPAGTTLAYSSYLGGSSRDESMGIALDLSNNAYLTGLTTSSNFPTLNPAQRTLAGNGDAFITKINVAGSAIVYSTYLGGTGTDQGSDISVDSSGRAYVAGLTTSTDFAQASPVQAAYGGNQDAFVTKLSASGAALIFSSYLGGHDVDGATAIVVDTSGNPFVTGVTFSNDFPSAGPLQAATGGGFDVFVTKLGGLALPAVILSTTDLAFTKAPVGSTSSALTVTITNHGDAALAISEIKSSSAEFEQTNTCGSPVAAGGNCTVSVTFKPSAAGQRAGTLAITDNAAGSPRTVTLSGLGTDFSFSAAPPAASTSGGQSATFTLTVTPTTGFDQTVTFTCAGLPRDAACAFNPTSVTPDGAKAETSTMTIATKALANVPPLAMRTAPPSAFGQEGGRLLVWSLLALALIAMSRLARAPRRTGLAVAAALLLVLAWTACGVGGTEKTTGTPPGSYTITVNAATSAGLAHSIAAGLTVR